MVKTRRQSTQCALKIIFYNLMQKATNTHTGCVIHERLEPTQFLAKVFGENYRYPEFPVATKKIDDGPTRLLPFIPPSLFLFSFTLFYPFLSLSLSLYSFLSTKPVIRHNECNIFRIKRREEENISFL